MTPLPDRHKKPEEGKGAPVVGSVCANSYLSLYAHTDPHMNLLNSQTTLSLEETEEKITGPSAIRCVSPVREKVTKSHIHKQVSYQFPKVFNLYHHFYST